MGHVDQGAKGAMDRALHALRDGQITFTAFERRTSRDWTRLARLVWKRWPLPASVGVEDVRQELLLALIQRKESSGFRTIIEKWDVSRGSTLAQYAVWNAIVWACRWLHAQRGAHKTKENRGSAGKSPSEFAKPLSSFVRPGERGEWGVPEAVVQAEQDQGAQVDELIAQVFEKLRSPRDRVCLATYLEVGGDVPTAAAVLVRDGETGMTGAPLRTQREGQAAVRGALHRTRWAVRRVRSELSEERV